jgi:hypothetical protein
MEDVIKYNYDTLIGKLFRVPDAMVKFIKHVEKRLI